MQAGQFDVLQRDTESQTEQTVGRGSGRFGFLQPIIGEFQAAASEPMIFKTELALHARSHLPRMPAGAGGYHQTQQIGSILLLKSCWHQLRWFQLVGSVSQVFG